MAANLETLTSRLSGLTPSELAELANAIGARFVDVVAEADARTAKAETEADGYASALAKRAETNAAPVLDGAAVDTLRAERARAVSLLADVRAELTDARAALERVGRERDTVRAALDSARAELDKARAERAEAGRRAASSELADTLGREAAKTRAELADVRDRLTAAKAETAEFRDRVAATAKALDNAIRQRDVARAELAAVQGATEAADVTTGAPAAPATRDDAPAEPDVYFVACSRQRSTAKARRFVPHDTNAAAPFWAPIRSIVETDGGAFVPAWLTRQKGLRDVAVAVRGADVTEAAELAAGTVTAPKAGTTYRLTSADGPSIANGDTWADSAVKVDDAADDDGADPLGETAPGSYTPGPDVLTF